MKRVLVIAGLSTLISFSVLADDRGGFKNDAAPPPPHAMDKGYRGMEDAQGMTIVQAKAMHDGASVSLTGNLIKKTGEDRYQFRDKTGTLDVTIPLAVFDGRSVQPDQLIAINGTLDKKQKPAVMKVDHLQKQ
ncbi:YdeI family stress tolerance OB fold protein [Dryocola clanedunensis]|uniref:YdeI family stress tolerance OB fold protein n=1 Tax=Cedecea sulfonylureivorans TaxID=3051154 RepID=UPI00192856EE|nr:YdeI family stress tolerance OB fold protein [Cedecea sulfonylureivorans]